MEKDKTIAEIINKLGAKKGAFLAEVESSIKYEIENCSINECLTLVERRSDGSIKETWYPSDVMCGYIPRLTAFLRKKQYKGYTIDSALTDKVVANVTRKFNEFYSQNNEVLAKPLLDALITDKVFLNSFAKQITETTNGTLPAAVKSQLTTLLVHKLEGTLNTNIVNVSANAVATLTTKVVAAAAAIPISKSLTILMLKHFAIFLKGAIAKVLASAAMKSLIAASVKKIAAAKILAALIALVGSKLGLSAGAAVAWIIAPLIAAFIAHEVYTLPKKLGKKVSVEIRSELDGKFKEINTNVISQIVNDLLITGAGAFVGDVVKEPEMKDTIQSLLKDIKPSLA